MTNHWTDIDNASLVFVFGANPAENHPACFAHINAARNGSKNAKLVVVDPRQTRTARQCDPARGDFYVRIRPGTNIAFTNGVLNWIFNNAATYAAGAAANMLAWHNGTAPNSLTAARAFIDDAGAGRTFTVSELAGASYDGVPTAALSGGYPKYCDSRFKVNTAGDDYQRATLTTASGYAFGNFPVIAASVSDPDSVYQQLKGHVAPYGALAASGKTVAADICGCTDAEIASVARVLIDHSRFSSSDFGASPSTPQAAGYRATTILYAMGQTQSTVGSQNIKDLATLQTLMGNMGRAGGGINALRGIHNVQGSTDMGNLFDSIPAYSANPGVNEHYSHYLNALFGARVENSTIGATTTSGAKDYTVLANLGLQQRGFANMTQEWFGNGSVTGADIEKLYDLWPKGNGVQHIKTFRNMTLPSGDANLIKAAVVWGQNPAVTEPNQSAVRAGLKNLDTLVVVDMFETETATVDRKDTGITYLIPASAHTEEAGSVTNSGRWIQWRERANSPRGNSKADLELLLRFAKALDTANAFTHFSSVWSTLTPAIAGNVFDVVYGKYGWTPGTGAFESVTATSEMWPAGASAPITTAVSGSEVVAENIYKEMCRPLAVLADGTASTTTGGTMWIYSGASPAGGWSTSLTNYNPVCKTSTGTAVSWTIKNKAKSRNNTYTGASTGALGDTTTANANANNYPRWGWSWLLNRRVFYSNGEIAAEQTDNFVSPGYVSCLFTVNNSSTLLADWSGPLAYRKYKTFADKPNVTVAGPAYNASSPHFISAGKTLAGRFAAHTEPYESPRPDLQASFGKNTSNGADLILPGTATGVVADFPLVLTTIRCVEHFQGGPITRNNPTNVEAEPEPWIEINPVDARAAGISDGDLVNVITARSNSIGPTATKPARTDDQAGRSATGAMAPAVPPADPAHDGGLTFTSFAHGFRARVDNSIADFQRVAPGVVAIPWHWGDRGLSVGSRANDLCIDSYDANTMIPEYKACLCKIEKA
ncbi:MAG TPA: molybdopterin-dependent oxidoreductase [Coriobacteriia bacterium]|jgi:formate dehydrogenase major subunit